MNIQIRSLLAIMALFSPAISLADSGPLGWGDEEIAEEMETDRPDFTEGTQTLAPGHFQFELGYTYTEDNDEGINASSHSLPELLMRIGLVDKLEFRFGWEGYVYSDIEDHNSDGYSDVNIGFKYALYKQSGVLPDLSVIAALSSPSGSRDVTSDGYDPEVKLLWSYGLDGYGVSGNLNFSSLSGEHERYLEVANSVAVGADLSEQVGLYVEYFGFYPTENVIETTEHYANGGFTFAVNCNVQIDLRVGFGLNDNASDLFTGVGLSLRH